MNNVEKANIRGTNSIWSTEKTAMNRMAFGPVSTPIPIIFGSGNPVTSLFNKGN